MVKSIDRRKVAAQAVRPSSLEPAARPAVVRAESEFSSGRGSSLRARALKATGAGLKAGSVQSTTGPTSEEYAAHAAALRDYALSLKGSHDAAQIQQLVLQKSVDLLMTDYPHMPTADMMDHAMAATTMVLVGPDQIGNLETIDAADPMVALMKSLPADTFAGPDLAAAHGTLRADFDDGTPNQAFHCFFFVAAGYVAGSDGGKQWLTSMGNLKHELVDVGPSQQDYVASHMSLELGVLFSQMRDNATGTDRSFPASMPALIAATMSETLDPATAKYTLAGVPYDFTAAAEAMHPIVTQRANEIEGSFHVGLVNFFNGLRDFLGISH